MAARRRAEKHRTRHDVAASLVGSRIRRLRRDAGYTFDAFVEEVGVGRGYVSELERGLVVPSLTALRKVAAALEVTVADLVLGHSARERLFDRTRHLSKADLEAVWKLVEQLATVPATSSSDSGVRVVPAHAARKDQEAVPLLSLKATAGAWSAPSPVEVQAFLVVSQRVETRGLFAATVEGRALEPSVPDGAHALFERPWRTPKAGELGLFVRWERGAERGRFTLKPFGPHDDGHGNGKTGEGNGHGREELYARLVRVLA